jgi:hypothetical protein
MCLYIFRRSKMMKKKKKREKKIDKDSVSVLKNIRVYNQERDIEQQTNNQTRSVCMKKKKKLKKRKQ